MSYKTYNKKMSEKVIFKNVIFERIRKKETLSELNAN